MRNRMVLPTVDICLTKNGSGFLNTGFFEGPLVDAEGNRKATAISDEEGLVAFNNVNAVPGDRVV